MKISNGRILTDCTFRSIVKNDKFHIFEEVPGEDPVWYIAKRISQDGVNFSERSESLLQRTDFDEHGQADPTILVDDYWKMYFDCLGEFNTWSYIGHAFSEDGDKWTKWGTVLRRGGMESWDDKSIHHPVILKHEGVYYLFYSGACRTDRHIVRSIGLATSKDGRYFIKHPKNPLITPGDDWDKNYVRPSRPFWLENLWYMLYWGFNGKERAIGLATSKDLVNWEKHGKIIENATACDVIIDDSVNIWYTVYNGGRDNDLYFKTLEL